MPQPPTPAQAALARKLVALYKRDPGMNDPLAQGLAAVGNAATRVARATHTERPAAFVARHLEQPGYVALKTAETLHKVNDDWTTAAETAPRGWAEIGLAAGSDLKRAATMPRAQARQLLAQLAYGKNPQVLAHLVLPRTSSILEQAGRSTIEDVKHPLRHPGFTALDALIAAGGASATLSRASAAARALGDSSGLVRSATIRTRPLVKTGPFSKPVTLEAPAGQTAVIGRRPGVTGRLLNAGNAYLHQPVPKKTVGLAEVRLGMRLNDRYQQSLPPPATVATPRFSALAQLLSGARRQQAALASRP